MKILQLIFLPVIILLALLTAPVHAEEAPATVPALKLLPAEPQPAPAQATSSSPFMRFFTDGEWYFSWGYSTETWAPSDIHVSQPALGNDFTVHSVKGHDEPGLGNILTFEIFVPQYNIRIGRFIDEERTLAVELNFDHTKYTSTTNQTARISGVMNGVPVNSEQVLDESTFRYNLHNGANHLMLNLVKRIPLLGSTNEDYSLAGLGKAGVGLVIPHSDNTILGNKNDVGTKKPGNYLGFSSGWWQFDGWTAGVEAGLRFVVAKPVYLELTDKVAYAYLYDIPVYQGTASQSLWMNEVIFSLGFTYDGSKKAKK